jgi:DNA-binding SARP family transcriptional activator
VKFRILGPLDVTNGAGPIALDAPKQRALLGVLLLHPNETVSTERLIDELWGERPPATATKVLQTYVSQLRRVVGADTIATRPPGYLLRIEDGALDADEFRRLTSAARDLAADNRREEASRTFREALALWRGPPLADVVFESFARNETERLEEERLAALMDLIDSELALGRHSEVVPELELLVRQHPLRERLRRQLMLALYRSGRQADALAVYQDARRTLVEELGIDPGRELQELERAILTQDAALAAPSPPARSRRKELRGQLPLRAIGALVVATAAVAALLAFALRSSHSSTLALEPRSVGFIDAASGKMTRSFAVGRSPRAIELTSDSVWVANGRDRTVTRIRRTTGDSVTIPVGAHPIDLVSYRDAIWVLTLENTIVPVDPRYDEPRTSSVIPVGQRTQAGHRGTGRIASGGGYLWITVPGSTVVRVDPANPSARLPIVPDSGARGPITFHGTDAWVAGNGEVVPIAAASGTPGTPIRVGSARGLDFADGSLWVVSGGPGHIGDVKQGLRRVNPESRLVETTISVGGDPVAVTVGAGSVWVAGRSDTAVFRVDPAENRLVDTLRLSSTPTDLAPAERGIWVLAGA